MVDSKSIALQINNLTIGYEDQTVLSQINLKLEKGKLVCLMGQNGTGKSTLIRTISGVQQSLDGQVFVNDTLLGELDIQARAKLISLVLTEKPSTGNLSVEELVSMGRYPYLGWNVKYAQGDFQIIDDAIAKVNLGELRNKKIFTLSDGQLQKTMIARALAQNGEIMILDEPTAHLDLNNRVEIMYLLKQLARETNKAILLATHELDLALQMADKLWLIKDGSIIEGVPEDLVLNESMDAVFGHKGFNLKTGKVEHAVSRQGVKLEGDGYAYLWTKNALERNGYSVVEDANMKISVVSEGQQFQWQLYVNGQNFIISSISDLLQRLEQI